MDGPVIVAVADFNQVAMRPASAASAASMKNTRKGPGTGRSTVSWLRE
ncbi:hypothetical protein GCM10023063_48510 [Arthrobacter methylotrophus]